MVTWGMLAAVLVAGMEAPPRIDVTTGRTDVRTWLRVLGVPDGSGDRHVQERLIVLSPTGRIVHVVSGHERSVPLPAGLDRRLLTPGEDLTLVHNHPAGNGLSQNDLRQLEKAGVSAVVAIGHDGGIYVARRGPRFPEFGLVGFDGSAYATALTTAEQVLAGTPDAGSRALFARHVHHVIALGLARVEMLEYRARLTGERELTFNNGRVFLAQVRDAISAAVRR